MANLNPANLSAMCIRVHIPRRCIRDVIFQGDPFQHVVVNRTYMFSEDKRLGTSGMNRAWFRGCYHNDRSVLSPGRCCKGGGLPVALTRTILG